MLVTKRVHLFIDGVPDVVEINWSGRCIIRGDDLTTKGKGSFFVERK